MEQRTADAPGEPLTSRRMPDRDLPTHRPHRERKAQLGVAQAADPSLVSKAVGPEAKICFPDVELLARIEASQLQSSR